MWKNKGWEEKIVENASRALLIAAGVLVGVLLLSLAVYLFTIFGNFGSEMSIKMNQIKMKMEIGRIYAGHKML